MIFNSRNSREWMGRRGHSGSDILPLQSYNTERQETGKDLGGVNFSSYRPPSQVGKATNRYEGK